ncbi:uncharacterized protein VTP21DRAFT_9565 [Calcarisporiella thermophila]|uniref:uncharacterized protein n=1 Tax=Calcarisporiella thermophila TaxID=911321 RepID=UPI003744563C
MSPHAVVKEGLQIQNCHHQRKNSGSSPDFIIHKLNHIGDPSIMAIPSHPPTPPLNEKSSIHLAASSPIPAKKPSPSTFAIFRRMLVLTDGRDKTLKLIQYFCKLLLIYVLKQNTVRFKELRKRLSSLISNFSTTRKILRLGHGIESYAVLAEYLEGSRIPPPPGSLWTNVWIDYHLGWINAIVGFGNCLADDLYCLGRIGVLTPATAKRAEPWSYRLWFTSILIDLRENRLEAARLRREQKKGKEVGEKLYWADISFVKLMCDLGFCGYDLFQCQFSDGFYAICGFISAVCSAHKLWNKQKNTK